MKKLRTFFSLRGKAYTVSKLRVLRDGKLGTIVWKRVIVVSGMCGKLACACACVYDMAYNHK